MKRIALFIVAAAMAAIIVFTAHASKQADQVAPVFGVTLPPDYRNWRLISVAHEAGNLK